LFYIIIWSVKKTNSTSARTPSTTTPRPHRLKVTASVRKSLRVSTAIKSRARKIRRNTSLKNIVRHHQNLRHPKHLRQTMNRVKKKEKKVIIKIAMKNLNVWIINAPIINVKKGNVVKKVTEATRAKKANVGIKAAKGILVSKGIRGTKATVAKKAIKVTKAIEVIRVIVATVV
jgi:hypothetical protein